MLKVATALIKYISNTLGLDLNFLNTRLLFRNLS
jgi:hypothetical protein